MKGSLPVSVLVTALALAGAGDVTSPAPVASGSGAASPAFAYGPPAGHTGGFGQPSCHTCHLEFELNAMGGSVTVEGLPERWEPGRTYPVVVLLNSSDMTMAGFQMSARFPDGAPAGALGALDPRVVVVDSTGIPYAQHTPAGTDVETPEVGRWMVEWVAPAGGGPVIFNVAANSANGDNSPFGDLIYTHERVVAAPSNPGDRR